MADVERRSTDELSSRDVAELRALFDAAWPDEEERFTQEDWEHSVGGVHLLLREAGGIVSHASVVERWLHADGHRLRTGYVEAVATRPDRQRRGLGTRVLREAGREIRAAYELGALATGTPAFYERLGWRAWQGPTAVRTDQGEVRTPDGDGAILVLLTPRTPPSLDLSATISCEWRTGDVW